MEKRKLTTAQLAVSIATATLISKLLGFVRELVLAAFYGTSYVTDAYSMGTSIPNTILAGVIGAIATAYMPVFSKKMVDEGEEAANRFTSQIINYEAIASAIFCVIGWIFSDQIVRIFAPGYTGETAVLTSFFLKIGFILSLLNSVKCTLQSYLEYKGSFLLNIFLGYTQNIAIISFVIISAMVNMPKLIIFGLLVGHIIYLFGNLFLAKKKGFKYSPDAHLSDSAKEVFRLAVPVFLGTSLGQINAFIDKYLASGLPEGSVSALHYGDTLVGVITNFTFGIFITILYPRLAKAFAEGNNERISSISERTLNLIVVLAIPFMFGAIVYSNEAIQVVYERGAFSEEATAMTASAFRFYAAAIAFTGVKSFLDRVYQAVHDTKTPATISVVAIVLNIILNLSLVGPMGHAGLAFATSISQAVSTVIAYMVFRRKYKDITLFTSWKKPVLVIVFSAISVAASRLTYEFLLSHIWMPRMVLLGVSVLIAVVIYLIFLVIFKFEELSLIKDLLKKNG